MTDWATACQRLGPLLVISFLGSREPTHFLGHRSALDDLHQKTLPGFWEWADNSVSTVKGFVEGLPGNAGVVFLVDRDGGTALTMTLWDSDDAGKATDRFAEQSRAATVAATGTELIARGSYEVVARS